MTTDKKIVAGNSVTWGLTSSLTNKECENLKKNFASCAEFPFKFKVQQETSNCTQIRLSLLLSCLLLQLPIREKSAVHSPVRQSPTLKLFPVPQ